MSEAIPIPVEVDPVSGQWSVDGLPMILVPRHLITNNLHAVEERIGYDASTTLFRAPGYHSAQQWCAHQAARHGLKGAAVVRHYLEHMSRRGWGRFTIEELDLDRGRARVRLDDSALAARAVGPQRSACYMFAGWLEGAVDHVRPRGATGVRSREIRCRAAGAEHCLFTVDET
ncbi:4-vinyl reductase [Streptomyces malaysiensis]|uniref:4-vinyl reductase n=1 Tax=Streptomyces malaysiensis TaxID=92644 RepID=UPI0011CD9DD4|nr:DUF5943 domain-containing protein [Streptomyces malaysiensis]